MIRNKKQKQLIESYFKKRNKVMEMYGEHNPLYNLKNYEFSYFKENTENTINIQPISFIKSAITHNIIPIDNYLGRFKDILKESKGEVNSTIIKFLNHYPELFNKHKKEFFGLYDNSDIVSMIGSSPKIINYVGDLNELVDGFVEYHDIADLFITNPSLLKVYNIESLHSEVITFILIDYPYAINFFNEDIISRLSVKQIKDIIQYRPELKNMLRLS